MAKYQTVSQLVAFALVAWRQKNNYRKNYGTDKEKDDLRNSLALHEWVQDNSVPACKITPEEQEAELAEREATWQSFKDGKTPESATNLKVFEMLYVSNGKLVKPEFSANAGFRRSTIYFAAMVQRFRFREDPQHPQYHGAEIKGVVPIRVTEYNSRVERIIDQQMENEMQGVGTKGMEDLEKLAVTLDLFADGARDTDIRKLYPSTTGQKLYNIILANHNWPELKIYERFFLAPDHPDRIRWSPLRAHNLIQFNNRFEATRKRLEGFALTQSERQLSPIEADEVDGYFRGKSAGESSNDPPMMKKKDILGAARGHKIKFAAKVYDSVANNTEANLAKYKPFADSLNTCVELIDAGKGDYLTSSMQLVKDSPDVFAEVANLVKAGKTNELLDAIKRIKAGAVVTVKTPDSIKNGSDNVTAVSTKVS